MEPSDGGRRNRKKTSGYGEYGDPPPCREGRYLRPASAHEKERGGGKNVLATEF